MNAYTGKDIARSFRQVRGNTIQIAEEIPADKYDFRAAPDVKSVGQLLAHIIVGPMFQMHVHQQKISDLAQLNFPEIMQMLVSAEGKPRNKAELVAELKSAGEKYASWVESLPDAFLAESVKMPAGSEPATKTRFEMLLSPKEHEMHHRGQLMLIERMIGVVPHLTRQFQARMAAHAAEQK